MRTLVLGLSMLAWICVGGCTVESTVDDNDVDISGDTDTSGDDTSGDTDTDADTDTDTDSDTGTDIDTDDCYEHIVALAAILYETIGACTVIIRLDYETFEILGYKAICGAYAEVTEQQARETAQADTGYGLAGEMLNPLQPSDEFVFHLPPGDFGGAAAVSADTGLSVFGGSIIWDGAGDVTYPATWDPPASLGSNCPDAPMPSTSGYELSDTGTVLSEGEVSQAVAVVARTAVPGAFLYGGYMFEVVVLKYFRSVGAEDTSTAEWIVFVNGGWLE